MNPYEIYCFGYYLMCTSTPPAQPEKNFDIMQTNNVPLTLASSHITMKWCCLLRLGHTYQIILTWLNGRVKNPGMRGTTGQYTGSSIFMPQHANLVIIFFMLIILFYWQDIKIKQWVRTLSNKKHLNVSRWLSDNKGTQELALVSF